MTPSDIAALEDELGIELPADWKAIVLSYPVELLQIVRHDGESIADYELVDDLNWLLQLNDEVRMEPIIDRHNMAFDWPDSYFVIGENGYNDYYLVDVNDPRLGVLLFDHMECNFEVQADDLAEFVELICEQYDPEALAGELEQ